MQKVYLLLRNNRQIGPHSLEELVKLGLKPHDLVWVEGKSAGWMYPTEIEALKPYMEQADGTTASVPSTPAVASSPQVKENKATPSSQPATTTRETPKSAPAKSVFVSLPNKPSTPPSTPSEPSPAEKLEQKAEALRQRAQSFAAETKPEIKEDKKQAPAEDLVTTNYTRSLDDIEETYTSWVYQQKTTKKKKPSAKNVAIAAVLVLMVVVGYMIFKGNTTNQDVAEATPKENATQEPLSSPAHEPQKQEEKINESDGSQSQKTTISSRSLVKTQATSQKKNTPDKAPAAIDSSDPVTTSINKEKTEAAKADSNHTTVSPTDQTVATADPAEKKKTLGEKIDGFFEKLKAKKGEATPTDETAQTTTPDAAGAERKSTQRSDHTAATPEMVNLTPYVDVSTNQPEENWMMGVKGLKITLKNHSNETVKTAAVEVRYYNEQDGLLEKKTVYFNNVPPKKSLTMAAPDHRLADHTDYQLLSASGTQEEIVKQ